MSYLGIRGFDSILRGGIPAHAEVLLLAPEGSDRHLIGAHWIVEGLQRGERVLLLLSGESPEAFLGRLGRMGIDVPAAIGSGSLAIVDWFTCWTQSVTGVVEDHRRLRASRKIEDLVSAIERTVQTILSSTERRAYVDFLPLALKAFDEVEAQAALAAVRAPLSDAGVTTLYLADRTMPEDRRNALLQTFHAVLDARSESREVLSFAVLGIGGVKLAARYHRVRLREDGARVETEAAVRTFSCPICGARVPFTAGKCPSCGTVRSEMPVRAQPTGVMDYVESLGRPVGSGRVSSPPPGARPEGTTSTAKGPTGRVNGNAGGRVNGTASGRVNGIAPRGRTNGMVSPAGRTNGLVNGLVRARRGVTNGITNGSGFTNGLGGGRARADARRSRWRVYLVPLLGAALLVWPLLIDSGGPLPRFAVDGSFTEWTAISGYTQTPPAGTDPAVALVEYKIFREGGAVHLFARVEGTWFDDPDADHVLYAFFDLDENATTGYRVQGMGAELLATVEGSGRTVTEATLREYPLGTLDPYNWTAWASAGSVEAAVSGDSLEAAVPWSDSPATPSVLLLAEDAAGFRSYSAAAFGFDLGALRAVVSSRANLISRGTPDVLAVLLEAFGAPVTVTSIEVDLDHAATVVPPSLPVTVAPGVPKTVTVKVDTSSTPNGTLLDARVTGIETNPHRPTTIVGGPVRAFVESEPAGKAVDGWFGDWGAELTADADPGPVARDVDLDRFAANRTGTTLFLYADVKGEIFAGTPVPMHHPKRTSPGPSTSPTVVPQRAVGEDLLRVYVDTDRARPDGTPMLNLTGADLLLEVRGIFGRITDRRAYSWQNAWTPLPVPSAINDDQRVEASLAVPVAGAIEVAFQTSDWRGPADSTEVVGTRGVRSEAGALVHDGAFRATFESVGRVELSSGSARIAWTLPDFYQDGGAWSLHPTSVGVRFDRPRVVVRYTFEGLALKEDIVFSGPELPADLSFALEKGERTLVRIDEGGSVTVFGGSEAVFEMAPPFAVDALGVITPLAFEADLAMGVLRVPLPASLADATFPVTIDPTTQWTLRDNGPTYKVGEQMGFSVAVGDFNGDGFADVLSGAPTWGYGTHSNVGYAYIYYGPFTANKTVPDVRFNGTSPDNGRFGFAVAAGKFNNDAYWDAAITRVSNSVLGVSGPVAIFYGSSVLSGNVSTANVTVQPPSSPANFGWSVAAANLDNANYDDLVIGEPGRDNNGDTTADGVAYVYKTPFASNVTSANYTLLPSANQAGQLGKAVAAGTIDSDAYADVVAGEPNFAASGCGGRFQFYRGVGFLSGSGNRSPNATISAPTSGCGSALWQFGFALAVGRVNGDAYADVLVGAPTKNTDDGIAYIYLASASGLTTGASADVTLASQSNHERLGMSVAIGDLAGDGTGDAIVGAPFYDIGSSTLAGRVYWFNNPVVDQTVDASFSGSQSNERFGQSVTIGKFTSDARGQLAIGAYLWDKNVNNNADNDGRVVVAAVPEVPALLAVVALGLPVAFWRLRSRRRGGSASRRHA